MKIPHDWQFDVISQVDAAWQQPDVRNVLMRAVTGAGKTMMLSWIIRQHKGAACVLAHRHEIVAALSLTLADQGVYHDLIASESTRRAIANEHVAELGKCFYRPGAPVKVASVQTLVRAKGLDAWAASVTLVVPDEFHHYVKTGSWSKAINMFTHPLRRILGPTATPARADGLGLGSHHDGYADVMVHAPPMRWLMDSKYLSEYDIVCPTSDIMTVLEPPKGGDGDHTAQQLRKAAKRSHIVGDAVTAYHTTYTDGRGGSVSAYGKRTVVFCTDVETANDTTAAFLARGIPAATLTGDTDPALRRDIIKRFKAGILWVINAVDIISEGFDLPAIECVIMARPTESLAMFMQMFGRALRTFAGKLRALIIDLVSNFIKHGPPDRPRAWSLDRRDKRGKSAANDAIPMRICPGDPDRGILCLKPYERILRACPFCGCEPPLPMGRRGPEQVDGDLGLLDAATLAAMRGAVERVDMDVHQFKADMMARHVPSYGQGVQLRAHMATQTAQAALRDTMSTWGGVQLAAGLDDVAMQRKFALVYGVDVLSARALSGSDADKLRAAIDATVSNG